VEWQDVRCVFVGKAATSDTPLWRTIADTVSNPKIWLYIHTTVTMAYTCYRNK
jgi:hypothetical protein